VVSLRPSNLEQLTKEYKLLHHIGTFNVNIKKLLPIVWSSGQWGGV